MSIYLLAAEFRGTDVVGRMGGEEFAVVMLHTDSENAFKKAEAFRQLIEKREMVFGQERVMVTVSIGVAEFNKETPNFDALVNRADSAMYEAKRGGRNRTVVDKPIHNENTAQMPANTAQIQ